MQLEFIILLSFMGLYMVWVLLPLVPSILIYTLFPNTAVAVSGPLANLTIRTTGAFAAYLIVFAMTYPLVDTTRNAIGGFQHQFWTINAQIKLQDEEGKEIRSSDLMRKLSVNTEPGSHSIKNYNAKMRVMQSGSEELPWLIFGIPSFGEKIVVLKEMKDKVIINDYTKTIEILEPIVISKEPSPNVFIPIKIPTNEDSLLPKH